MEVAGSTDCLLFTFPKVPSPISWTTVYSPSFDGGKIASSSEVADIVNAGGSGTDVGEGWSDEGD